MKLLVDTNVISELRKLGTDKVDAAVGRWAAGVDAGEMWLSAVTIHELEVGVRRLEGRDPRQAHVLRSWLDGQVLHVFEGRILPVDTNVALESARLVVQYGLPLGDSLVAATGLAHRLAVATRNTGHFRRVDHLAIINPWETA